MNNNDYMEMIEVPVESATVKVKPNAKKRKTEKKIEKLEEEKEKLVNKINQEQEEKIVASLETAEVVNEEIKEIEEPSVKVKNKRRVPIIGIEIALIVALVCTIVFSNLMTEHTFINSFFFKEREESLLTDKDYSTFEIALPYTASSMTLLDSGLLIEETGSVYAPSNGIITNIVEEAGKFNVEITHSNSFKTVLSGIDHAYFNVNDQVFYNMPIGYSLGEGVTLCFYDNGEMLTNYNVENSGVVWLV